MLLQDAIRGTAAGKGAHFRPLIHCSAQPRFLYLGLEAEKGSMEESEGLRE